MNAALLLHSIIFWEEFTVVASPGERPIEILTVQILHEAERRLKAANGLNALLDRFEAARLPEVWCFTRKSTV